jgi:hypothetical protein
LQLKDPWTGPVLAGQAGQDGGELGAGFNLLELLGAILSDLFGSLGSGIAMTLHAWLERHDNLYLNNK